MPGEGDTLLTSGGVPEEAIQRDPGVRTFTWQELSKLNQRHNAHVAVRGKVYDVSRFIARHPGGADQLLLGAGRDITTVFESYHHFNVYKVLEKYYVGELVNNELPMFPKPGAFYKTLRERVDKYFKDNNIDPKISYWMFLRYFIFFALANLCWLGQIQFHETLAMCVPIAMGFGFFSALVALTCTHDASHFAVTHKPWVWRAVGSVHDFYRGASFYIWITQHVLGHHPYTNIDGADPDSVISAAETPDFRRIRWEQKWMPRYLYQHVYVPLLYCFMIINTRIQDFFYLYRMRNSTMRLNKPPNRELFIFFCGKITYFIYRFVIPALFIPWQRLLLLILMGDIVENYWMAFVFEISHVTSEVEWPKPDKDNVIHKDWAEMQIATTQDYATDSWFWTVFTGALNHQTAHHLFPGVIQAHYHFITPIVRQTCEEFGLKYHYVDTMWEAINCHVNHLKNLGQHKELKTE